jgi:large subunit ribosomal protein L31
MKRTIHPDYTATEVRCTSCGTTFTSRSTSPALSVDVCSNCHPFYTGQQKLTDTAGRIDRFNRRQSRSRLRQPAHVSRVTSAQ